MDKSTEDRKESVYRVLLDLGGWWAKRTDLAGQEAKCFAKKLRIKSYEILLHKNHRPAPVIGEWEGDEVFANLLWAIRDRVIVTRGEHDWNSKKHNKVCSLLDRLQKSLGRDDPTTAAVMDTLKVIMALSVINDANRRPASRDYLWGEEDRKFFPKLFSNYEREVGRVYRTFTADSFELECTRSRGDDRANENEFRHLLQHWKLPVSPSESSNLALAMPVPSLFQHSKDLKKSISWSGDTPLGLGGIRSQLRRINQNSNQNLIDEGFVTPNEDHKEVTPIIEKKPIIDRTKKDLDKYWDWGLLRERNPERHLTWETLGATRAKREASVWSESRQATVVYYSMKRCEIIIDRDRDTKKKAGDEGWQGEDTFVVEQDPKEEEDDDIPPPAIRLIDERLAIADIKSVLLDVASETFKRTDGGFRFSASTYTENVLPDVLQQLCQPLAAYGHLFGRLRQYSIQSSDDIISEALKMDLRSYLHRYESLILKLPEDSSILFVLGYIRPLVDQLYMLKSIVFECDDGDGMGRVIDDVHLLDKMYNGLCFVASPHCQYLLAAMFVHCCQVYYSLLDKWVFEGETNSVGMNDARKKFGFNSAGGAAVEAMDRSRWVNGRLNATDDSVMPIVKETIAEQLPVFLRPLAHQIAQCRKTVRLLRICHPKDKYLSLVCEREESVERAAARPRIRLRLGASGITRLEAQCSAFHSHCLRHLCAPPQPQPTHDIHQVISHRAKALDKFKKDKENARRALVRKKARDLDEQRRDLVRAEEWRQTARKKEQQEYERSVRQAEIDELIKINTDKVAKIELVEKYRRLNADLDKAQAKTQWKLKRMKLADKRKEALEAMAEHEGNILPDTEDTEHREEREDTGMETCRPDDGAAVESGLGEKIVEEEEVKSDRGKTADAEQRTKDGIGGGLPMTEAQRNRLKIEEAEYGLVRAAAGAGGFRTVECLGSRGYRPIIKLSDQAEANKRRVMQSEFHLGYYAPSPPHTAVESPMEIEETKEKVDSVEADSSPMEVDNRELKSVEEDEDKGEGIPVICDEPVATACMADSSEDSERKDSEKDEEGDNKESETQRDSPPEKEKRGPTIMLPLSLFAPRHEDDDSAEDKEQEEGGEEEEECNELVDWAEMYQSVWRSVCLPVSVQLSLVNRAAIRMMLDHYGLIRHLEDLRRYYFLMDGGLKQHMRSELFRAVEEDSPGTLLVPGKLDSLVLGPGPHPNHLSLVVTSIPPAFKLTTADCLKPIALRYTVDWPLNIIVTPETIGKYNVVFAFLVNIQRASWCLERAVHLLRIKYADVGGTQYRQLQLYRHVMSHYVQSVQSYLTNTVLEDCWSTFKKKVDAVKDVDDLYAAHVAYVKDVLYRCLLNKRSSKLRVQLERLTETVFDFYFVLKSGEFIVEPSSGNLRHSRFGRLRHCFRVFLQLAHYVARYVERLVELGYQAQRLDILYIFLTMNRFYLNLDKRSNK